MLHNRLENNRSELDVLCPAMHYLVALRTGGPCQLHIVARVSVCTLSFQTAGLACIPFPRDTDCSLSFSARKFYLVTPQQANSIFVSLGKDANEFSESVRKCSCQAISIKRKATAPCAMRPAPMTDKGLHSLPGLMQMLTPWSPGACSVNACAARLPGGLSLIFVSSLR